MNGTNQAPMSALKSLGYFAFPWLLFLTATYVVIPALAHAQVPLFVNFLISLGTPLGVLILASLVAYRLEGGPWKCSEFKCRFRLRSMRRGTWLWTLGLSIFMFLAPAFLSFSSDWIRMMAPVPDPLARMFVINPNEFMGVPLAGAWWLALGYLVYVIINVSGEELWWRGYILPRQEASMGSWAWLAHGFM
jgi:membrane protease YdiL (CAAX protease family)